MQDDNEPTWGDSVPGQSPSGSAIPNQRSMPVVGRTPPPSAAPPHSAYYQQAAQHFSTQSVPPPTIDYPGVPPTAYPSAPTPAVGGGQRYPSYPPPVPGDSFITRLMEKGVQGLLFRQPWFQDLRHRNPDLVVYVSYGVGVFVSIMLSFIPSSFVVTVLTTLLWVGIGYLYVALGTKLAHQFLLFGICLVGGLVMAFRVLSAIVGLSGASYYSYEPAVVLMVVLLVNLAGVAAAIYVGLQVHRGIQRMSQP